MTIASTAAAAPTGTAAQKQAASGLASFDSANFEITDGFVGIKAGGVSYTELPQQPTDSVVGRNAAGTGVASAVSFSTVVDEGGGLEDGDFASVLAYGSPTRTAPGSVLIKTGAGAYNTSVISYENTNTSIAKRDDSGRLQATALIIGGDATFEVLAESSGTLSLKTPAQGVILSASGASKPQINTGGSIKVGDMVVAPTESTFHSNSTYGSVGGAGGGTTENSAISTRWLYTNFIEAANEKNATGTGIGLGSGTGFAGGSNDTITFVTNGTIRAKVTSTRLEWVGIANGSIDGNAATITSQANSATIAATNANTASRIVQRDGSGNFSAGTITANLTGTASALNGTATTTSITTGAAATAGSITGNWSLTTGSRMQATYADLAEYYEGDTEYAVGTVVVFGGDNEVTISAEHKTTRIAGVVSDQSAYTMNANCPGIQTLVALQGKVPVNVIGPVAKGDMLVASSIPGYAVVDNDPKVGSVIGKAIAIKTDSERGTVDAVVGRV